MLFTQQQHHYRRRKVAGCETLATLQRKNFKVAQKPFRETFIDILCRHAEDIKGMITLLEIMMTVSPSAAACERGFSCMNREKNISSKCFTREHT